jgi:RsmE family RNA methyltransferase
MNTVLFFEEELQANGEFEVRDDRARHMVEHQSAECGKQFRVAQVGGKLGLASVIACSPSLVRLRLDELREEPRPPIIDLIVGVSRPQTIKKILEVVGALGVRRLFFVSSKESQKSYLSSKTLREENIFHHLRLGLEQAGSSYLPEVSIHPRLAPFLDDTLPKYCSNSTRSFIAEPKSKVNLVNNLDVKAFTFEQPIMLAVGPEGGWHDFEVEMFSSMGFVPTSLGVRILRVEHALCYLLGQIDVARALSRNTAEHISSLG